MDRSTIIHGKSYDLVSFAPHSPGGPRLLYALGRDATDLFESSYVLATRDRVSNLLSVFEVPFREGEERPPRPPFEWHAEPLACGKL